MTKIKEYAGLLAIAILLGGGIFFAGAQYGSSRTVEAIGARLKQMQGAKAPTAPTAPATPEATRTAQPEARQ